MTVDETSIEAGRAEGDWLRRLIAGALALYLAPAILAVLVVGAVGMACCGVLRWFGGRRGATPAGVAGRHRGDGPRRGVAKAHLGAAARSRSSRP